MKATYDPVGLTLATGDGQSISLSVFSSKTAGLPWVIINSATGVRRALYTAFAGFLANEGFNVVTYDYRGVGNSPIDPSARRRVQMADWGEQDFARVLSYVAAMAGGEPILVVGHSVGGQIVALAPLAETVTGVLAIAAQSGWWGWWRGWSRVRRWLDWHIAVPVITLAVGRLPDVMLPGGLPAGIALQWARWCRSRDYLFVDGGRRRRRAYEQFNAPVVAWSFGGDPFAPRPAVDALRELYPNAEIHRRHFEGGNRPLGHFGFFKEESGQMLWDEALAALREMADSDTRAAACAS